MDMSPRLPSLKRYTEMRPAAQLPSALGNPMAKAALEMAWWDLLASRLARACKSCWGVGATACRWGSRWASSRA